MVERGSSLRARSETEGDRVDPDRELVSRWREGDDSAFEALVRRHERRVFRLLHRMLGSREEAEDVAQEALINLYTKGRGFRGEARFSTFVYRVAANAALNRRRTLARARQRHRRLAEREEVLADTVGRPPSPEEAMLSRRTETSVQHALGTLPPKLRLPLLLCDVEGLGYAEISTILSVAEGTVKSRIHRARQALRRRLEPLLRVSARQEERE
jgi:RNA polymerase sigma-70 factor (ECF subfamily)